MRTRFALGVAAFFAAFRLATAQVPLGAEFQVNTFTTGDQISYGAAMDRQGRFAIVWDSDGEDGSSFAAVGRIFDETQAPVTGDLQVNTFTTGSQGYTRVAVDGPGRFVVVWASDGQDGSGYGVFARRFDQSGTPLSGEIPVNTFTTLNQLNPFVATDPSGGFVVAWSGQDRDGSEAGAAARRFDRTGAPLGPEFLVNTFTTGAQYANGVAVDGAGNFVIAWTQASGGSYGIFARRYDAAGNPLGGQFQIDTTSDYNGYGGVASDRAGNFVVVWHGAPTGTGDQDILARRYNAAGAPLGDEFVVNAVTTGLQRYPQIAMDPAGNFTVAWGGVDADGSGMFARRFDRFGTPVTADIPLNSTTAGEQHDASVGANAAGDFVTAWHSEDQDGADYGVVARRSGLTVYDGAEVDVNTPSALTSAPAVSNLNGVFETGETVVVEPTWANRSAGDVAATGTATDFSGPAGATYTLDVAIANYGTIGAGGSANCYDATGVCYVVTVPTPGARPVAHWDARLQEQLANSVPKTWSIHIGGSFPDVPQNAFYPFIENLFHNGVTGGCAGGGFCPGSNVTRAQMAVFLLKSKFSSDYMPPPATGTVFTDVPAGNAFAPWIENLAALGITGGCGGTSYCPDNPVTRQQMAVFLIKTLEGSTYDPPDCAQVFDDVPCTPGTGFSDWVEDLAGRGITGGCQTSPPLYCPTASVLRQQMAVFLVKTFGLKLYGP